MNLTLVRIVVVLQLTGASLFAGHASQGSQSPELTEHIKAIEGCLQAPVVVKNAPKDCHSISQRMAELQVPALSVAVIHNGQIEWAKGYGVKQLRGEPVTANFVSGGLD